VRKIPVEHFFIAFGLVCIVAMSVARVLNRKSKIENRKFR
jgi:hypothetical protein